MTEIKFRGRRLDNHEWVYGDLVRRSGYTIFTKSYIVKSDEGELTFIEVNPSTLGQYTGLKDKNGVEIYEGDIVSTGLTDENDVFVVGFNDKFGGYYIERPSDGWREFLFMALGNAHYNEVIGNIHDNAELVE